MKPHRNFLCRTKDSAFAATIIKEDKVSVVRLVPDKSDKGWLPKAYVDINYMGTDDGNGITITNNAKSLYMRLGYDEAQELRILLNLLANEVNPDYIRSICTIDEVIRKGKI